MKRCHLFAYVFGLALLTGLFVPIAQAYAKEEGDLIVRLRGLTLLPDTDGTTTSFGGNAEVGDAASPELDFTYFITDNIAAELILATTQHNVVVNDSTAGKLDLGHVWLLPPILTLQYHFLPKGKFSPYVGAGINYTVTYGEKAGSSVNTISYSDEFGYAFQVGLDYEIDETWSLNLDIKKLFVETDITTNATDAPNVDLDPLAISFGLGYKF